MQLFISNTDYDWYNLLKNQNFDEVNFWRPGSSVFKALMPGELFLFKLKQPYNAIVGGGFFTNYSSVPIEVAWDSFGLKNGTSSEEAFFERLKKYRESNRINPDIPSVGCIILSNPFFLEKEEWIKSPMDWAPSIVVGKRYSSNDCSEGERVFREVNNVIVNKGILIPNLSNQTTESTVINKQTLGYGAFRIMIADAYFWRCAISNESAYPVLQATYIRPLSKQGQSVISNGLLLRSDLKALYNAGYITITSDYIVLVSKKLKKHFGDFTQYHKLHERKLLSIPAIEKNLPNIKNLEWHYNNVFLK